jgi:hypothetical protein
MNKFLAQTRQNILSQQEAIRDNRLQDAQLINDLVVPDELPQTNSQIMNEVEIQFLESGENLDVIRNYYTTIYPISLQCPYAGGAAVDKARVYIAMLNPSEVYNDDDICLQSGIYRNAAIDSANFKEALRAINIQPNPANNIVTVSLIGKFEGVCKMDIKNALGETVLHKETNCKDAVSIINVSHIATGFYTIKVSINNSNSVNTKLIIIR